MESTLIDYEKMYNELKNEVLRLSQENTMLRDIASRKEQAQHWYEGVKWTLELLYGRRSDDE